MAVDWARVKQDFDSAMQSEGSDCAFVLRSGEQFTIKGVLRFLPEVTMTDGLHQDRRKLSVMADRWEAAAPANRDPEKGDQVTVHGRRFAVEEADPATGGNQVIGWRLRLKG